MKLSITILALVLSIFTTTSAQEVTRFSKSEIGEKGCTVYTPEPNAKFEKSLSEDGSSVFVWDKIVNETQYAVIHVELKDAVSGGNSVQETLLKAYLDFLKTQLSISATAGYGLGHRSDKNPQAVGIIDYWQDTTDPAAPMQYFVKGWASPQFLTIYMMGRSDNNLNEGYKSLFTNGFQHK